MSRKFSRALVATLMLFVFGAHSALAAPDISGSTSIVEPNGLYTAVKTFEVYSPTNGTNPLPLAGNYTYLFTITAVSNFSFVCLIGFTSEAPAGSVTAAGYIPGSGIAPSATTVSSTSVKWDWLNTAICPSQTSETLYIHSTYAPGTVNNNVVSTESNFSVDAEGTCVGPFVPPTENGEPLACTIGWWKNRADEKKGTLKFFPDPQFAQVVDAAVALSSGIFPDAASLLTSLGSKGSRPIGDRAKQQLAATLLSLAGGDLFPDNQKCKLFDGNTITSNACGTDISIADAVSAAKVNIQGTVEQQHEAMECLDDINNGVGVVQ